MSENQIAAIVFDTCKLIMMELGPGLLEKTYRIILAHELRKSGLDVREEVVLPIKYDDLVISDAYRIDIVVEDKVILELKTVDEILPVHEAQLLTYLRLSKKKLGLVLNFNAPYMGAGVRRIINGKEKELDIS